MVCAVVVIAFFWVAFAKPKMIPGKTQSIGELAILGVRDQIVFIGVAQEKAKAFNGTKVNGQFQFNRDKTVYVNHYYFYIDDEDFGPLFLKVGSYAPWGIKLCLNGHEWAKRQLDKRGIGYQALDNGFLSCDEPEKLQQICDSLGPEQIDRVFRKWLKRIPLPFIPDHVWTIVIVRESTQLTEIHRYLQRLEAQHPFDDTIRLVEQNWRALEARTALYDEAARAAEGPEELTTFRPSASERPG